MNTSSKQFSSELQDGLVICNHGHFATVENNEGEHFKCTCRRKLGIVVAGDRVKWQQTDNNGGDITKLEKRSSVFSRLDFRMQSKVLASNINHIVIVNAVLPEPDPFLIDSYLAAASNLDCDVTILFNKIDLLSEISDPQSYHNLKQVYEDLGYKTAELSCKDENYKDSLFSIFENKCSILVGLSGVGKSSISNLLMPDLDLRTQEISENTLKGTHTTTNAALYHIDPKDKSAGDIIDSPGVREYRFKPKDIEEIMNGFVEFADYKEQCKFNNCKHLNDKGCAIRPAVESGEIKKSRWESYAALVEQFEEQQSSKY